ncbi:MAG: DUF4105 domain-containing protein, partial [Bdellovibrionales bacterium]|nr:DUF4105 domain-containing protein [Bdellovibrionales bacterium]
MFKALILSTLLMSSTAWSSEFKLVTKDQSPEALKLLVEVNRVFPIQMKDAIDATIEVEFIHLNGKKFESLSETCGQRVTLGNAIRMFPGQSRGTLQVDRVLLNSISKPEVIKCIDSDKVYTRHPDTLTYAKAILVHELSHFYDNKVKASSDLNFLNLGGWISKGLVFKKRTNLNTAQDRSPDAYEFKNPAETFAVNFEFFLLDKNFKCRRPSFYGFYTKLLGFEPFGQNPCEMNKKITLITQSIEKKPRLTKEIDPSRIYQIHYLFAGKGKEMMSRWGHAMFRIVLCAPGRVVGPDCLQDFAEHVVVSYRANVEDMTMNYKKGIDGGYASQLFLMNMADVVNEYTKGEFRDVISLPLNFSRDQIKRFSDKLLENYWSYKGSYFFITNNCASEAMNLLRA